MSVRVKLLLRVLKLQLLLLALGLLLREGSLGHLDHIVLVFYELVFGLEMEVQLKQDNHLVLEQDTKIFVDFHSFHGLL